jgi:hypothetical protein
MGYALLKKLESFLRVLHDNNVVNVASRDCVQCVMCIIKDHDC